MQYKNNLKSNFESKITDQSNNNNKKLAKTLYFEEQKMLTSTILFL